MCPADDATRIDRPYPAGSRFRRAGYTPGVFYCTRESSTAIAELAFYRVLFFAESPRTPWPANPSEYTAFAVSLESDCALDLMDRAFDNQRHTLEHLTDYRLCQTIETALRSAGGEIIVYNSVRDSEGGVNYAVLKCSVFVEKMYEKTETWKLYLSSSGVRAFREFPPASFSFPPAMFCADPRLADMPWERS